MVEVSFFEKGGAQVGDKRLSEEQVTALFSAVLASGKLPELLARSGGQPDVLDVISLYIEADGQGDLMSLAEAFGGIAHHTLRRVGMVARPGPQPDFVPARDGLVPALESGDALVGGYPLVVHNAAIDQGQLAALAAQLGPFYALADLFTACQDKVAKNIAPRAAQGIQLLRGLAEVIAPALEGNEALTAQSQTMRTYLSHAVEQAQRTKKIVARVWDDATEQVTEQVYEQARSEARAEVRGQLDERVTALLK